MKKLLPILLLITALLFSGCSLVPAASSKAPEGTSAVSQEEPSAVPEESAEPSAPESGIQSEADASDAPESAASNGEMSPEQVMTAYADYAAFERYWYQGGNADAMTKDAIEYEQRPYCRYETPEIATFADFREKALLLMTEEQFDTLQTNLTYIDKDGALYGPQNYGSGGNSSFAKNESEAVKISDTHYELKVGHYYYTSDFVEDADPDETVLRGESTCAYVLTDNGWRFSSVIYESKTAFAG